MQPKFGRYLGKLDISLPGRGMFVSLIQHSKHHIVQKPFQLLVFTPTSDNYHFGKCFCCHRFYLGKPVSVSSL